MTDPVPETPSPQANRAAAGVAFIGSGTSLVAVGLAVLDSLPLAAAGFAIIGLGVVFVVSNQKAGS